MFDEKTLKTLRSVQEWCKKQQVCKDCPCHRDTNTAYGRCLFGKAPFEWSIDEIKKSEERRTDGND